MFSDFSLSRGLVSHYYHISLGHENTVQLPYQWVTCFGEKSASWVNSTPSLRPGEQNEPQLDLFSKSSEDG